jgi:hypothetical protein
MSCYTKKCNLCYAIYQLVVRNSHFGLYNCMRLLPHNSRLTTHDSQLTTHNSRLTTPPYPQTLVPSLQLEQISIFFLPLSISFRN